MENYLHPDSFKGMHQLMWLLKLLRIRQYMSMGVPRLVASMPATCRVSTLLLLLLLIGMP